MSTKKNTKTTITFKYNDIPYTLEFTADSLKKMQKLGFNFGNIDSQILTVREDLFCGAFIANHNNVQRKDRIKMFHDMAEEAGEDSLFDVLLEMMNEAIDEINYSSGNVKWEVNR